MEWEGNAGCDVAVGGCGMEGVQRKKEYSGTSQCSGEPEDSQSLEGNIWLCDGISEGIDSMQKKKNALARKKILQAHSYIMKILELGASSPMRKNRLKQKQTNMRYICIYLSNQRKSSAALLWMTSRSGFSISHLLFSSLDERVGFFFCSNVLSDSDTSFTE